MHGFLKKKTDIARSGSLAELSNLLHEKHPEIIAALLENRNLPVEMVIQLIRKKSVTKDHVYMIAAHREWQSDYTVKLELILSPMTPRSISLKFMKDIMVRDLAVISRKVTIHPVLREVAVNYLKLRFDSMRTGEKIVFARTSSVAFLPHLMDDSDERVFRAALRN
ncbi:hypothetical protein K8T06_07520, partial [bacterium]|nr:hypothetical protein [bacterium]